MTDSSSPLSTMLSSQKHLLLQVSDGPVMSMLFPEELELLLCGGALL